MKLNLSKLLPRASECEVLALGEQSWPTAAELLSPRRKLRVSFVDPEPTPESLTALLDSLKLLPAPTRWNLLQENLTNFWWAHKSIADPNGTRMILLGDCDGLAYRFQQALNYLRSIDSDDRRYICGTGELPDNLRELVFTGSVQGWLVVVEGGKVVSAPKIEATV